MSPRAPRLSPEDYTQGILAGDRATLARAITLVESTLPSDRQLAEEVLEGCLPHTGNSLRVGITGIPGVGKSTFIEALGFYLTGERGERLAVLSIDPSSPISGGSILGDKTRMEKLALDERAFIRPSPSAGHLGGVARRTREALLLCEAAGYTTVFVETVGVGQSETAVRSMTDCFLLLLLAGAGDELQGMKRGVIEMTDIAAITKADQGDRTRIELARRQFQNALHLLPAQPGNWHPPVHICSAFTGEGIAEIWTAIESHRQTMEASGVFHQRRQDQLAGWLEQELTAALREEFFSHPQTAARFEEARRQVLAGTHSPHRAAQYVLQSLR